MNNKRLLDYLHMVLQIETECRTLEVSMQRNRTQAQRLSQKWEVEKPYIAYGPDPVSIGLILFGGAFLGADLYVILNSAHNKVPIWQTVVAYSSLGIIGLLGAAALIIGCLGLIGQVSDAKEMERQYQIDVAENKKKMEMNQKALVVVNQDYHIFQKQYEESCDVKKKYYDIGVLYPKYHNIVAVSMFVQYLESGRCDTLQGHTGCYNLFEEEARQDIIIAKLDQIIDRLDRIQDNQFELKCALESSNQQIKKLSNQTNITNQHLAVQAYNSDRTAWNTQAIRDYMIFRDIF